MIQRFGWVGSVIALSMAVGTACGDDETGDGGGTTTAGTTSTGSGGTTGSGTGGSGGGVTGGGSSTGGAGTGGAGTGGAQCVSCEGAGESPLGNFPGTFCDTEAATLYDALVDCACQACSAECGTSWVCVDGGPMPDAACETCYVATYSAVCSSEANACLSDLD
jgi:hypothetical protein